MKFCHLAIFAALGLAFLCLAAEPRIFLPHAPGHVVFQGTAPKVLLREALEAGNHVLLDWHGAEVSSGAWPGGTSLTLPPLPNGYYTLKVTGADGQALPDCRFAVISDPATRKPLGKECFYAVDTAQSWLAQPGSLLCPWHDGDTYRLVSDLVAWTGFTHIRERLAWHDVNPQPGKFNYGRYMTNAELLHERQIQISGMFHDAPSWADSTDGVPRDLAALFRFCRQLAADFAGKMVDWEFWNEMDIGFSKAPVWDYSAALKAASLGFRSGAPDLVVAPGAACAGVNTAFHHAMYRNDIAQYTDLLNYHTYAPPADYATLDKELHNFLIANKLDNRAIWLTECGINLEGHSVEDGVMPGFKAHSPAQEMLQAEFYPKSQLYHQQQGIAKNFFFVFPPYNEAGGLKDWGVMRRDGTVKPAYAAMATLLEQLGDARLLGELHLRDTLKAFLLEKPDRTQTLVFWQLSAIDSHADPAPGGEIFELALPAGTYRLVDMLGTPSTATSNGNISLVATRYPQYLAGLRGLAPTQASIPPGVVDRHLDAPADTDLAVVLQAALDAQDFTATNQKSIVEMTETSGRLTLAVWNLSEQPKSGTLHASGGALDGLPPTIDLPPMGKVELDLRFTPDQDEGDLAVWGGFNGQTTTKLDIPYKNIQNFLRKCQPRELAWHRPDRWERNTSAQQYGCRYDAEGHAIQFDVAWTEPVDKWFYPVYRLEDTYNASRLLGVEFEVESTQDKLENDVECAYVMVGFTTPDHPEERTVYFAYPPALTTWESRRVLFDQSLPADATIQFLRIGCNPHGTRLAYRLRNLRLLLPRE